MKIYYCVAGHCFAVNIDEHDKVTDSLSQYEPFRIEAAEAGPLVFEMDVVTADAFPAIKDYTEELYQDDDGSQISSGHGDGKPCFKFLLNGQNAARMVCNDSYDHAVVTLERHRLFGLNNCLMVMYALATARRQTALFHASAIGLEGYGYLFLGKSGTGKSTHSALWLKHIEGTELMNDDNPIVRMIDGLLWVYGSPWSGKTPCYRNVKARLGAIVDLSQAPHNQIRRLKGLQAYAALMPAISGKRWDKSLAEGLHEMETLLVQEAPTFHLECLPDADAAMTCLKAVKA
jgi:hypothetical protein